jgi:hypothetical protein
MAHGVPSSSRRVRLQAAPGSWRPRRSLSHAVAIAFESVHAHRPLRKGPWTVLCIRGCTDWREYFVRGMDGCRGPPQ